MNNEGSVTPDSRDRALRGARAKLPNGERRFLKNQFEDHGGN